MEGWTSHTTEVAVLVVVRVAVMVAVVVGWAWMCLCMSLAVVGAVVVHAWSGLHGPNGVHVVTS